MSGHLRQQQRIGESSHTQTEQGLQPIISEVGTLRLRPASSEVNGIAGPSQHNTPPTRRRRVVWSDETVDNEGLGRKSSKICCIYHKPKAFDESSGSESSSSDNDDDDSESSESESDAASTGRSRKTTAAQSDSDDSSNGRAAYGPNLSTSLRRKHAQDEHHHHHHRSGKSHACRKRTGGTRKSKTRGSTTQTITSQPSPLDTHENDDDSDKARQPFKANAYERGSR